MAKALFHKSQRVFVKPVGTWAVIEHVVPHWVKDVNEPLRISYDCGLGRPFQAHELVSEQNQHNHERIEDDEDELAIEKWSIARRAVSWRQPEQAGPVGVPGTYPAVTTDEDGRGGWRVAGSEFDRDPQRVEHQARMIVHTPDLIRVARRLTEYADAHPDAMPEELKTLAQRCTQILRSVYRLNKDAVVAAE